MKFERFSQLYHRKIVITNSYVDLLNALNDVLPLNSVNYSLEWDFFAFRTVSARDKKEISHWKLERISIVLGKHNKWTNKQTNPNKET